MSEWTESSVSIQDEEEEDKVLSIITSKDDITINGIIGLNPDWSSIG